MQLTVTGKQLGVGEALRSHVEVSLEMLLGNYFASRDRAAWSDETLILVRAFLSAGRELSR